MLRFSDILKRMDSHHTRGVRGLGAGGGGFAAPFLPRRAVAMPRHGAGSVATHAGKGAKAAATHGDGVAMVEKVEERRLVTCQRVGLGAWAVAAPSRLF